MTATLPVLVVRNTFIDIEEWASEAESSKRSSSVPRSWKPLVGDLSPAPSTAASTADSDNDMCGHKASDSTHSSEAGLTARPGGDAEGDSDELLSQAPWPRSSSPRQRSERSVRSAAALPPVPLQAPCDEPSKALLCPRLALRESQQAAAAAAPPAALPTPRARTLLRAKLSWDAKPFRPSKASSAAAAKALLGKQVAATASPEAPGAPGAASLSAPMPAADPAGPPDEEAEKYLEALSQASLRRQNKLLRKGDKKLATSCAASGVGAAISQTNGVASVAVSKHANETSFAAKLKPGHQWAKDSTLQAAKAAVLNLSASLSTGTCVIGYLSQPFEEFPGGFRAVLGSMQQRDEAEVCWSLYQTGRCPCPWTCHRKHPQEEDLERITVTVIG